MKSTRQTLQRGIVLLGLLGMASPGWSQFKIGEKALDFHGFFSQGFLKSSGNNYLTMNTRDGSAAMTDGGLNVSLRLTDKFRVAAQAYSRNIGQLSNGKVDLDFAMGDYRFKDWFGIRAGKVKTPLGLYNDTQDMEFLHTWAILPQSMYPLDLRSLTISHIGGDVYGEVALAKRGGSLSYQAYIGKRPDDLRGGYHYGLQDNGYPIVGKVRGWNAGYDLRWNTPVSGLMLGTSYLHSDMEMDLFFTAYKLKANLQVPRNRSFAAYGDYSHGRFRAGGEYRSNSQRTTLTGLAAVPSLGGTSNPAWFLYTAFRVHKRMELGTYYSKFTYIDDFKPTDYTNGANKIGDYVATVRFDIAKYWNVKVETHFMNGYGNVNSARGFYVRSNPTGFAKDTNLLVLRTGWNF